MVQRVRSKTVFNVTENYQQFRNGVLDSLTPCLVKYEKWDMTDWVIPNYRQRIKNGEIINNPCTLTVTKQKAGGGYYYAKHTSGSPIFTNNGTGSRTLASLGNPFGTAPFGDLVSSLLQSVKQTCLSRVDSPEYSIAEDLGEIADTIRFLRNPFQGLRNLAGSFDTRWKSLLLGKRKRFPFRSVSQMRIASLFEAWLEYRNATMPLMRTACLIVESMSNMTFDQQIPIRTQRMKQVDSRTSGKASFTSGPFTFDRWHEIEIEAKAVIRYRVKRTSNPWLERYGLRAKDIPETLWNLKPLSFMVDRAFNVSQAISGVMNLSDPSITFLAASTTTKKTVRSTAKVKLQTNASYSPLICDGDAAEKEVFSYDRQVWTPTVKDTIPAFLPGNLVSDLTKTADLISLIGICFTGSSRRNADLFRHHQVGN